MDLAKVKHTRDQFLALEKSDRDQVLEKVKTLKGYVEEQLPALCESDQAAVAWMIARLLGNLGEQKATDISDLLYSSTVAYGILAVDLLGWLPEDGD